MLILTEKPSVAKDVVNALAKHYKTKPLWFNGYAKCQNYFVTWTYGHLLEIDDSIAPEKWSLDTLPIFPTEFKYKPQNQSAKAQLEVIRKLLSQVDAVVISTDAGREGQLIAELILRYLKCNKKVYRLWTSDALTEDVIIRELQNLKPNQNFESLYWAALARQHADWLVGINLTRAVTIIMKQNCFDDSKGDKNQVWSVGRVQSPTLRLIVERDLEVENFKKTNYYVAKAKFRHVPSSFEYVGILGKRRLSLEEVENIVKKLSTEGLTGVIVKKEKNRRKEVAPELFSLTTLQEEASKFFGFTAEKTHEIAQKLYQDYKLITYPRTEATGLPENLRPRASELLKLFGYSNLAKKVMTEPFKRVFDEKKLTDHHAIIPLGDGKNLNLSFDERNLLDLIIRRFVCSFMEDYEYDFVKLETKLGEHVFYSFFKTNEHQGWKAIYYKGQEKSGKEDVKREDSDTESELEVIERIPFEKLEIGSLSEVTKIWYEKRETKPPLRFTDGSLIALMKKLGLGTPATRSQIIETLVKRGYVVREKGKLISTLKGRVFIEKFKDYDFVSVETTSKWEEYLETMVTQNKKKPEYEKFCENVKSMISKVIRQTLSENCSNIKTGKTS